MKIKSPYLNNTPICVADGATRGEKINQCCITIVIQRPLYKSENTGSADKMLSAVNVIRRFYSAKLLYLKATDCFLVSNFIIRENLNLSTVGMPWRVAS